MINKRYLVGILLVINANASTMRAVADQVFFDSFPVTAFDLTNWSNVVEATIDSEATGEPSPPYALRLNAHPGGGDSLESVTVNLGAATNATLTYSFERGGILDAPEADEDLIIEFWNGSAWEEIDRQLGGGPGSTLFTKVSLLLPIAALHDDFRVRLWTVGTASSGTEYDNWFVDDIQLDAEFAPDCDGNGIPDECDFACGPEGGPCDIPGCGLAADCDGNGITDGCDLLMVVPEEQVVLTASDPQEADYFGSAAAISDSFAIVGSYRDDHSGYTDTGSVYVYEFANDQWSETAKLTPSYLKSNQDFGRAVAIYDEVVVVGSPGDDSVGPGSGAAYVFRLRDGEWLEEAQLLGPDTIEQDLFGNATSIFGNVILVGAYWDDLPGGLFYAGSAYVFRYKSGQWVFEAKLRSFRPLNGGYFGTSVSLNNDVAAIGASGEDSSRGSAYVFRYRGGQWEAEAKLTASDASASDNFGTSISVFDDLIVIGSFNQAVYVFRYDGEQWLEEAKLVPAALDRFETFGASTAMSGNIVLAASQDTTQGGKVYGFRFDGTSWIEELDFIASDTAEGDLFGWGLLYNGIRVAGSTAIITADHNDHSGVDGAGSAYVFTLKRSDCNGNGSPDDCDVESGSSRDCDLNGIPDECEIVDACEGDVNDDNYVDPLDVGFVTARFDCTYPDDGAECLAADVNRDCSVDPLDAGFVLSRFGDCAF